MANDPLRPLLERFARAGDADAMEALVGRTRKRLLAVARRIGSPQDAEDSVQAAYHALLRRPEIPAAPILPWLVTTVVRIAYRRKAVAQRQTRVAERLARPRDGVTPPEGASLAERARLVRREVAALPEKYRNALVLYHLEGLSAGETAQLLEIPPSTLTTRLQRGRMLLRSSLGPTLTHGCCVAFWILFDGLRHVAGPAATGMGMTMKAKSVVVMASVGLATGALGLAVGNATATERSTAPRASVRKTDEVARMEQIVARKDAEIRTLRDRLEGESPPASSGPSLTGRPGLPGVARNKTNGGKASRSNILEIKTLLDLHTRYSPKSAQRAAARLGVTEEELAVATSAFKALANDADPATRTAAVEALQELEERGALATAALLRGVDASDPTAVGYVAQLIEAAR
ncbi:MAG: sigma-70 family RNA polymerase sigma factor, partial [Planctomycetota bacterium]|nr:sigma-70 family RNA polymerase sigma factor [Planctomycetota bacterium]